MTYFCNLPYSHWLNGDFGGRHNRPCVMTYKFKDHLSPLNITSFYLEDFKVRLYSQPRDYFDVFSNI